MIMKRFNMLTQLRKDIKSGNVHKLTKNEPFFIGTIVLDNDDDYLRYRISFIVERWAKMIVENFLLITFVAPTDKWRESMFTHNNSLYDKFSLLFDPYYDEEQEKRANPLLRDILGLPQEGSYLVFSTDFYPEYLFYFSLTERYFEDDIFLLIIRRYCDLVASQNFQTEENFKILLHYLHASPTSAQGPLLDLLIDYVSITSIQTKNDVNKNQLGHAYTVIEKLKEEIKTYQGSDFEDRVFHLFEASEKVVTSLYKNRNCNIGFESYSLSFSDSCERELSSKLDDYSKKLFKTYNKFSEMVEGSEEDIDYSGLTIYLGKIVENELHLSIGQMLRWSMDIDMPMYYNKYCRLKGEVHVRAGNQDVDLNKRTKDDLQEGIPMGTLIYVYYTLKNHPESVNPQPISERLKNIDRELLNFIKFFSSKYRNKAGHLDLNSKNTYEGAREKFKLFLTQFLDTLYRIRIELQGSQRRF